MTKQFIYGLHAVDALLQKHPKRILSLCVLKDRKDNKMNTLISLAKKNDIKIEQVSRLELDRITQEGNHQGILAYCTQLPVYAENELKNLLEN
jgi:23S rRNA (guanosine2251-2'-O)-methyltransferase